MNPRFAVIAFALAVLAVFAADAFPAAVVVEADGDKYMYPFINDLPADDPLAEGRRGSASAFGAYGAIDLPAFNFDDRDAQFFLDFATAAVVEPGKGASSYRVLSLTVTIVVENNDIFSYDPSFDLLGSYSGAFPDPDAGRPMELYGVGYRSGWTRSTFTEDSPFQTQASSSISDPKSDWNRKRNAFALDFSAAGVPRDVSNNVEEGFEVNPWAVADSPGSIDYEGNYVESPLGLGSLVPEGRVFRFQVDLTDPHIVAYLQDSLHAGHLHFMVSSLYGTTQQSTDIPRFYTKDHDSGIGYYLGPQLEADILLMPSTSVSRASGTYRVSFDTVTGQNYQVEYRDNLASGHWLPLGGLRGGNGETLTHDDAPPAGVSSRFYRVAVFKESQS
jgi:hypothetical protein